MIAGISDGRRAEDVSTARVEYRDGLEDVVIAYALAPGVEVGCDTRIGGM